MRLGLKVAIDDLLDPDHWWQAAQAAQHYFQEVHQMDGSMRQFESEFIHMMT